MATDTTKGRKGSPASPAVVADVTRDLTATLREAAERHGDGLVMLCSFQKEESAILHELVRVAPRTRVVTIDTGVLFPETIAAWRAFEAHYGVTIAVEEAKGPWTGPDACCSVEKVAALERALDGATGWVTGIRREQSPTRAGAQLVERDEQRGIWKYNPLAAWTEKDVWRYLGEHGLPYHPLHDQGYSSIGCACCTQPGSGREGRWAGTEKLECGLHVENVPGSGSGSAAAS